MELSNKVILITGGSKGIGLSTARLMHEQGANVISQYNTSLPENYLVNNERIHFIQADLSTTDGVQMLWQEALHVHGKIDVIVNCAGVMRPADIESSYDEWISVWDYALQLNVISVAWLSQKAAIYFASNSGGTIINLSSRVGYMGSSDPKYLNYAASKGAVMALTKTIARAYAKNNVLAYVIAPGMVETDMTKGLLEERGREDLINSIPLKEFAMPSDIAEMILFLATGKARHATGSTFHINSGSYI